MRARRVVSYWYINPGASVRTVLHVVVNKASVSPDRNSTPGGAQVRFRRHGILAIAKIITGVGQQFNQRDSNIGGISFLPFRRKVSAILSTINRRKLA